MQLIMCELFADFMFVECIIILFSECSPVGKNIVVPYGTQAKKSMSPIVTIVLKALHNGAGGLRGLVSPKPS